MALNKQLTSVDFLLFCESFDFLRGRGDFLKDRIKFWSGFRPGERPDGVGLNSFDSAPPILNNEVEMASRSRFLSFYRIRCFFDFYAFISSILTLSWVSYVLGSGLICSKSGTTSKSFGLKYVPKPAAASASKKVLKTKIRF